MDQKLTFIMYQYDRSMVTNPIRILFYTIICYGMLALLACNDKPEPKKEVVKEAPKTSEIANNNSEKQKNKKSIMFFGDSLTAGYGLSEEESFPSLVQRRIDSLGLPYQVINAGLSGETSAGGLGRIDWVLQQPVDIFILELGANDMLRGLALSNTKDNLKNILEKVKSKNPEVKLIVTGMQSPPNMGQDYSNGFNGMFGDLATDYQAGLIPFLLDGVAGDPNLNLPDGKHPNAEGQKIVVENVWKELSKYLENTI